MLKKFIVTRLFAYTPSIKFIGSRSKIPHHSQSQANHTQVHKSFSSTTQQSNFHGIGSSIFLPSLRYPQLTE